MATTTQKKVENTANQAIDKTKDATQYAAEQVKQGASTVADKAKEYAGAAVEGASHAAGYVADKADQGTSFVGGQVAGLADTVRKNTPNEGIVGAASDKLADGIEATGRYIEEQGMSGMVDDVTDMIKRNPIPALLVGVAVGYLLARATSRS